MEFPMCPNDDDDHEHAEADAKHLRAVKILDAWAKKHVGTRAYWQAQPCSEKDFACRAGFVGDDRRKIVVYGNTPAGARAKAADALAKHDPSLLEGIE